MAEKRINPNQTMPAYIVEELINQAAQTRFVFKDKQLTKEMNKYKWTHSRYKRR